MSDATVNEAAAIYEPPNRITAIADGTIRGRRFVKINASKLSGSPPHVVECGVLGERPFAVAAWDAVATDEFGTIRWGVVGCDAGATVTAGQQVMVDATGRVITWVFAASMANVSVGVALSDATVGTICYVALSL